MTNTARPHQRRRWLQILSLGAILLALALTARTAFFGSVLSPMRPSGGERPQADEASATTADRLAAARILAADPFDLARRLSQSPRPLAVANAESRKTPQLSPRTYSVGDQERFWVLNLDTIEPFQAWATLQHSGSHLDLWVQTGLDVSLDGLLRAVEAFDTSIYPQVRRYFGSEPLAQSHGEERLTVLNARFTGATGYFSSGDQYPSEVVPLSNQRSMFYINPEHAAPGTATYNSTLAHELQHMIHWYADPNEDAWVNEGASELAIHLCGYSRDARVNRFQRDPDIQLTTWDTIDPTAHYGASFLFLAYFAERFGPDLTRALVASPLNGVASFKEVLSQSHAGYTFDELFADWVIANYLDGALDFRLPPFAYEGVEVKAAPARVVTEFPAEFEDQVHQFAADYVEFVVPSMEATLTFTVPESVRLVPNQPYSGAYQWWSNRGDNSDMTLTRSLDLSSVQQATLTFRLWYEIEEGWDFAYVEASTDGGASWDILSGVHSTTSNLSGNSYGPGYTGRSGASNTGTPEWVEESIDLSAYAGQQILLRFEYVTDEAVNHAGLCLDDVSVAEIDFVDDVEHGNAEWSAEGFVRSDNVLPQAFLLQLIRMGGGDEATVERLKPAAGDGEPSPDGWQSTHWPLTDLGPGRKVVLVIAATSPGTVEVMPYRVRLTSS